MKRVLVIEAPELHLGFLGCYGNEWLDTPHLDRLAAESVVFDRHFADCPWAAARGAWSGRFAYSQIQAKDLFAHLNEAGISCQHVYGAERWDEALRQLAGLARGLLWLEMAPLGPPWQAEPEAAMELLSAIVENPENEAPLFDPPPRIPDDDRILARVHAAYAATVAVVDEQLGSILTKLEELGVLEEMLVVVTAHQGLGLGEHGLVGPHSSLLYEEVAHVPLLVHLPGGQQAGLRVSALTQPVDLFPTLLQAFDLPPVEAHGFSLWPLLRGEKEPARAYAVTSSDSSEASAALRTPEWALFHSTSRTQLYRKPEDRWEVNDVAQHHLEWVEKLIGVLQEFIESARKAGPLLAPKLPSLDEIEPSA